jgi:ribose transport system ATP-binding protein
MRIWAGAEPVDVRVHRGEILGVAGLDGQGQSEFVRILAGVQHAAEGAPVAMPVDGEAVAVRGLDDATRHGIVYVSGDRKREGIFANMSIFENMLMPLYRDVKRGGILGLIDWKSLDGVFSWEAEKLSIKMGDRGDKITSLSGGNQQKVLIARGFAMQPDIIVLNDPARGIDVGAKTELYRQLRDFAAAGKSVVYMSSELEEFIGFASRVIVFRHGTVFDEFVGAHVEPARILEAMFGQTAGIRRPGPRENGRDERSAGAVRPLRVEVDTARAWSRPSTPVDNPLRGPAQRIESPVRTAGPRRMPTIDKAPPPHVPHIRIVEFSSDPERKQGASGVSPFRRGDA